MKIITPSRFVKDDIVSCYGIDPKKIEAIYEGASSLAVGRNLRVDNHKTLGKYNISRPFFVYAGSVFPHKNLKKALQAIKLLNKSADKRVLFVAVGAKGVFKDRLREEVKRLDVQEYVRLPGYVSDEDLFTLYKNSAAFVYPSTSEGFGLQGLEAMDAGTLLLASDIAVFREIYAEYASYFDPNDAFSIAKEMEKVLAIDDVTRRELVNKSQEFTKKYSWSKMAKETLRLYKKVLAEQ